MAVQGKLKADFAVFADPGSEPSWVYDQLKRLIVFGHGKVPIYIVKERDGVAAAYMDRLSGVGRCGSCPLWTLGVDGRAGPLKRQCTTDFKIVPILRKVREMHGLKKGQRALGRVTTTAILGISLDEAMRIKPSRDAWITNEFPLCDLTMRREDCQKVLRDAGLGEFRKSACVFCPYRSDAEWLRLQRDDPKGWKEACEFDELVRNSTKAGIRNPIFVHRTLKPLREVKFSDPETDGLFGNECSGICGV
jgi:hypothetical protein